MPHDADSKPAKKSNTVLLVSALVGIPVLLTCCCGTGIGTLFFFFRSGVPGVPGLSGAKLDSDNLENRRAWAEKTVKRL